MIPQTPPRTAKESLTDMGNHIEGLEALANELASELATLAMATLPDGKHRARLLAAARKQPLASAFPEDYHIGGEAPEVAKLISKALGSAACMAREVEELKQLRMEPFKRQAA